MAHSTSNDVTSKYIGAYPLPKMQEYNSYKISYKLAQSGKKIEIAPINKAKNGISGHILSIKDFSVKVRN
jgi:hypothetical protein